MSSPIPTNCTLQSINTTPSQSPRISSSPLKETEIFLKTLESQKETYDQIGLLRTTASALQVVANQLNKEADKKEEQYEAKWEEIRTNVEKSDCDSFDTCSTDSYDSRGAIESPQRDSSPARKRTSSVGESIFAPPPQLTKYQREILQSPLETGTTVNLIANTEIQLMEGRLKKLEQNLKSCKQINPSATSQEEQDALKLSIESLDKEIRHLKDAIAFRKVNLGIYK